MNSEVFSLFDHKEYVEAVAQVTNEINQQRSVGTNRKGFASFRDKLAYYKVAVFFAYGYVSIIQTMVIFLGITPQALENINGFFSAIGIPLQLPVDISSIIAIVLIIVLFFGGIFAMRFLGLYRREQELGVLQNPGLYLLCKQNHRIIQLLEELKEKDEERR